MDVRDTSADEPDLARARARLDEIKTNTAGTDVVIAETKRLAEVIVQHGRRNHFADKFRAILRGAA